METIEYENLHKVNLPFTETFSKAFHEFLNNGSYILGKKVNKFEQEFAAYCQSTYCAGVGNGLDALIISLRVLDLQKGDEVIVAANSYIASILSILHNGLVPVLVDADEDTCNIDPAKIEAAITPRTRAIMTVHMYGKLCEMDTIVALANRRGLLIIEDCAQAHGAMLHGKIAGSFGDISGFSFYPTKNLGALADGGAVICTTATQYDRVKRLRNYGSTVKYYNEEVGFNSRLDEIQAAFLLVKLKKLDEMNEKKRSLANLYLQHLKTDFKLPLVQPGYRDVYHIFNVRHPKRDELRNYLASHNIRTEIHYPVPPSQQKALQGLVNFHPTPVSDKIHATTLSLPISSFHSTIDISRVIEVMNNF